MKALLSKSELLALEDSFCKNLEHFLKFDAHAIYFPHDPDQDVPSFLAQERRLLAPLPVTEVPAPMLLLEGVNSRQVKKVLPLWESISHLCLQNALLVRNSTRDLATGLSTEENLFARMLNEFEEVRAALADPAGGMIGSPHKLCFGMIVLYWHDARKVARWYDYDFSNLAFNGAGRHLASRLPSGVLAAPLGRNEGRHEYGIILPAASGVDCKKLAETLIAGLPPFGDAGSGGSVQVRFFAGYALYPRDMEGDELRLPMLEQAMRLRDRARLAAQIARTADPGGIMAFASVLRKGGKVLECLDHGKVRINLGIAANAREGIRFQVYGPDAKGLATISKGMIVLLETRLMDSIAEIFHVDRAGVLPERGDRLEFIDSHGDIPQESYEADSGPELAAGLLSHAEFIRAFNYECPHYSHFALGICGITPQASRAESADDISAFFAMVDELLTHGEKDNSIPALAGHYGSDGLIFFHAGHTPFHKFYLKLSDLAGQHNLDTAFGVFDYPFLNFSKADSEDCALKALEYGRLLPPPHIGVFDSLALNISADKKYSLGDTFGAIEEYKLSLLANPDNTVARNSLGVCLAAMGKFEKAKKLFYEAFEICDDNALKAKICYNLGTVFQKQSDMKTAHHYYRRCLRHDPAHFFAWIRVGWICEDKGQKNAARKFYEIAARNTGGDARLANVADRSLARLEARQKGNEKARELLHNALLRNPGDSKSLTLLARIYLDNNEDPAIAETLARESVELGGGHEAWWALAQALEAVGKSEEASQAKKRALR